MARLNRGRGGGIFNPEGWDLPGGGGKKIEDCFQRPSEWVRDIIGPAKDQGRKLSSYLLGVKTELIAGNLMGCKVRPLVKKKNTATHNLSYLHSDSCHQGK